MHSLSKTLLVLLLMLAGTTAQATSFNDQYREQEVDAAVARLQTDPDLAPKQKMRTLSWVDSSEAPPQDGARWGWLDWIRGLFAWLAASSRLLLWLLGGLLVALLGVYLFNLARWRANRKTPAAAEAPSHVRDLDIRPESLPADIGAAALELWDAGQKRAAFSLLYRGTLSRLAHSYAVPIRQSTTEGDCILLAAERLEAAQSGYVIHLVRLWQHMVYGGIEPPAQEARAVCADFRL